MNILGFELESKDILEIECNFKDIHEFALNLMDISGKWKKNRVCRPEQCSIS